MLRVITTSAGDTIIQQVSMYEGLLAFIFAIIALCIVIGCVVCFIGMCSCLMPLIFAMIVIDITFGIIYTISTQVHLRWV